MASPSAPLPPDELEVDRGYELASVSAVMIALQLIAVALRFYARRITKAPLAADDYLIIPALITGIALCCVGIAGVAVGHTGRHTQWVLQNDPDNRNSPLKFLFMIEVIQIPFPITLAKLSILAFVRRIFPLPAIKTASLAIGAVVVAHGLVILISAIFQCEPVVRAWDPSLPGRCIDQTAWARYISVPNILTDAALLALPLPAIWNTQTSVAKRVGLTLIFAMGSFNIVASAVRMSFFFTTDLEADPFWTANKLHIWCILEASTAVIAACMPSMWPVLKRALPWGALTSGWSSKRKAVSSGSFSSGRRLGSPRGSAGGEPPVSSKSMEKGVAKGQSWEMGRIGSGNDSTGRLVQPADGTDVEMGWPHHPTPAIRYC